MTTPSTDAVAQARLDVWGAIAAWNNPLVATTEAHDKVQVSLDAYAAAVSAQTRAECAERVRVAAREGFHDGAGWATGLSTKAASDAAEEYARKWMAR